MKCYWPPASLRNFAELVQEHGEADSTWKQYDVTILKTYGDYSKAVAKYQKLLNSLNPSSSDSQSVVQTTPKVPEPDQLPMEPRSKKRAAKANGVPDSAEKDSNMDVDEGTDQPGNAPGTHDGTTSANPDSSDISAITPHRKADENDAGTPNHATGASHAAGGSGTPHVASTPLAADGARTPHAGAVSHTGAVSQFVAALTDIKTTLRQLAAGQAELLSRGTSSTSSVTPETFREYFEHPFENVEEFKHLDSQLTSKSERATLTAFLSTIGGRNCPDAVRRMMRRMGNNGLWSLYSFKGKTHKRIKKIPFRTTTVYKCVARALLKTQKTTEREIEGEIATFLRQSPHQLGGNKFTSKDMSHELTMSSTNITVSTSSSSDASDEEH